MQMEGQKSALLKAQEALTGQCSSRLEFQIYRESEEIRNFSLVSHPAIIEEDCDTSGQTAKLAYTYERYESCFAIAGADYCVMAADYTRDHTKILQLNEKVVMASCGGFQAAVKALQEVLSAESWIYKREHNKPVSCPEMARLFYRFKKYHHDGFNVLGGLDSEGKGYVPKPVNIHAFASGVGQSSQDTASTSIEPPIFKYKLPAKDVLARLSETEAVGLAKTMFASATHTGDRLEIVVLNASGLRREYMDLRKDCDSGGQCSRETNIENHNPFINLSIAEVYQKQKVGQISALMKAQEALTGQSSSTIGSSSFGQKPAFGGAPTKVVRIETKCRIGKGSKDRESEDRNMNRSSGFGQKPAFGGAPTFGAKSTPAFVSTSTPAFFGSTLSAFAVNAPFGHRGALFGPMFGSTRLQNPTFGNTGFGQSEVGEISLISLPAVTEVGGTSGQTAKLAYKYERFESCFAIAGLDYCVIAADYTGDHTKITKLNEKVVMASCGGFQAAVKALQEVLSAESWIYKREHNDPMSYPEMRDFFYCFPKSHHDSFNVLGGLDSEGKGYVFTRVNGAVASGLGHSSQDPASTFIVPPILKYELPAKDVLARLSETEAVDLAKTMFASVTHTGDKLEIVVLNASGLRREYMDLRKDCDRYYGQVYSRKKQRK